MVEVLAPAICPCRTITVRGTECLHAHIPRVPECTWLHTNLMFAAPPTAELAEVTSVLHANVVGRWGRRATAIWARVGPLTTANGAIVVTETIAVLCVATRRVWGEVLCIVVADLAWGVGTIKHTSLGGAGCSQRHRLAQAGGAVRRCVAAITGGHARLCVDRAALARVDLVDSCEHGVPAHASLTIALVVRADPLAIGIAGPVQVLCECRSVVAARASHVVVALLDAIDERFDRLGARVAAIALAAQGPELDVVAGGTGSGEEQ